MGLHQKDCNVCQFILFSLNSVTAKALGDIEQHLNHTVCLGRQSISGVNQRDSMNFPNWAEQAAIPRTRV